MGLISGYVKREGGSFVEYLDNNFRECIILGGSSRPFEISACLVILVLTFDDLVKGIWGWGGQWRSFTSSSTVFRLGAKDLHVRCHSSLESSGIGRERPL